jgi:ATP-binding cassette, subfamily C (CFTR/MRP), member 4
MCSISKEQEQPVANKTDVSVLATSQSKDENDITFGEKQSLPTTRPKNLMKDASVISRMLFYWPFPLLKLGLQRPLEESDLPEILPEDSSDVNKNHFERIWREEQKKHPRNPSLHRAILKDYLRSVWYVQPAMAWAMSAKIVQAVAVGRLIESFETGNREGYMWAGVLVACGFIILFEHHHVFFVTWRKGMQIRISAVASIYAKSLRLSSTHQETNASAGKIMNLASNDVERFLLAALFINYIVWSPLQSFAILAVGWLSLGPAFAAGFGLLVFIFVPLQFYLSNRFAHFRASVAAITDRRVNFVSQAINGARLMKMSGYEWRFLDRIQQIRQEEVGQIAKANRLKAWNETLFYCCNVVISLVIFYVHVFTGNTLHPGDVFTVFTLINVLQMEMTKHVSLAVMGISECYVSINRIQNFLEFPEMPTKTITGDNNIEASANRKYAIRMSDITCYWNDVYRFEKDVKMSGDHSDTTDLVVALSNVTVDFKKGQLTCILGAVGSGKSALLQAVVGELPVFSGNVVRNCETVSYAAQDPWIMDGTVKENICMGETKSEKWYRQVVAACSLLPDFDQLLHADETIVGDRGVQLSGGQRARIGLARALYRDADVLVLDDPLSAVDAKVGRQLFNEAILELAVNRGRTVILATHQHQYVTEATCVLTIGGKIEHVGSYEDCVTASNGKLKAHSADAAIDGLEVLENFDGQKHDKYQDKANERDSAQESNRMEDTAEMKNVGVVHFDTFVNYAKGEKKSILACVVNLTHYSAEKTYTFFQSNGWCWICYFDPWVVCSNSGICSVCCSGYRTMGRERYSQPR